MVVEGGYKDADDNNLRLIERKNKQGMNFPCPDKLCVLTFSNEDERMKHVELENHTHREVGGKDIPVEDRVKQNWIKGLS